MALGVLGIAPRRCGSGRRADSGDGGLPERAFLSGFVNGYLTMALGALVFGIVIVNAALARRERRRSVDPLHHSGRFDRRRA
ncbi:branched-chain amino acid transport system II carrier protein [Serratia ureilytica]